MSAPLYQSTLIGQSKPVISWRALYHLCIIFFLQNTFTYFLFFSVCSFAQFCNVAQDESRFSQILASWTWKTIELSHKVLPKKHSWTFKTKKWSNLRRVSMARSKKKLSKTIQISTLGFQYIAINIEGWLFKICNSFVVYRQIWLNLPTDDSHFLFLL
jgi:hypothetical protein